MQPQVCTTYRVQYLRKLNTLDIDDVWREWTVGVPVGGNALEEPFKTLEENKGNNKYRDLSNKQLKTAVFRRVHIAQYLKAAIREIQQGSGISYEDAVQMAITQAEELRVRLGKNGKKCSLYRFWEHIRGYKTQG